MRIRQGFIGRFLISYLLALVPVLAISLILSSVNTRRMQEREYSFLQNRMQQVDGDFAALLEHFSGTASALANNNTLNGDFTATQYKRYQAIEALRSIGRLDARSALLALHLEGEEIFTSVGYSTLKTLISSSSLSLTDAALEKLRLTLADQTLSRAALLSSPSAAEGYLLLQYPVPSRDRTIQFFVTMHTVTGILNKLAGNYPLWVELTDAYETTLLFPGGESGFRLDQNAPPPEKCQSLPFQLNIPGMRLRLYYQPERLFADMNVVKSTNALLIILGMLLSSVISVYFCTRRSIKLKQLQKSAPIQSPPQRYGDEYSFIRHIIENSSAEINKLYDELRLNRENTQEQVLRLILNGSIKGKNAANELLASCEFSLTEIYYTVSGLLLENDALCDQALDVLRKHFSCVVRQPRLTVLACLEELSTEDRDQSLRAALAEEYALLLGNAHIGCKQMAFSQVYKSLSMAENAFREVITLLSARNKPFPEKFVCFERSLSPTREVMLNGMDVGQLTQAMEEQDARQVLAAIEKLRCDTEESDWSGEEKAYLRYCLLQHIVTLCADAPGDIRQQFLRLDVADREGFYQALNRILSQFMQANESQKADLFDRIRDYIESHYQNPNLTAEEVAEQMGINKTNLSAIFKRKCGLRYIDYLSGLRIEKAKELLRGSDLSVPEITLRVGYLDHSSFRRKFKSSVGCSMAEYRQQAEENQKPAG